MHRLAREHSTGDHMIFVPNPVAWTEIPSTLPVLARQRDRWHHGLADVLRRHGQMVLNPHYSALELFVMPYFVFVELLAPMVKIVGLLAVALGLA